MPRKLAFGMSDRQLPSYIICACGAWNSRSEHHIENYGDRCYMCRRGLFEDMPVTECPSLLLPGKDDLLAAIKRAEDFIKRRRAEIKEIDKKAIVVCLGFNPCRKQDTFLPPGPHQFVSNGCGAELPIAQLTYIQTHWYTPPSGCTGGDYWNAGEGQFVCPKCGKLNRLGERHDVAALKQFFAKVEDKYDD